MENKRCTDVNTAEPYLIDDKILTIVESIGDTTPPPQGTIYTPPVHHQLLSVSSFIPAAPSCACGVGVSSRLSADLRFLDEQDCQAFVMV